MSNPDCLKCFLDEGSVLLDTYKGRDKVLRTLCYLTKLIAENQRNSVTSKKWSAFSSQMSATRSTLRLLDDVSVIKNTIEFGLGKNEPDRILALLGVLSNCVDHIFLVTEKVSWFAKYNILNRVDKNQWDNMSSFCWVLSSYLTLLKSCRYLLALEKRRGYMANEESISIEKFHTLYKYQMMTLARIFLDFVHAVSTLPPGFLWSSKLKGWQVGVVGTTSSVLGIYLILYKKWWIK